MSANDAPGLRHPLLVRCGVRHGFGVADPAELREVVRPRQVHGRAVAFARAGAPDPAEADAVVAVSERGGGRSAAVGVVTADCIPILASTADGRVVGAIHAGWRGLADGVIEAGIAAIAARSEDAQPIYAVIGPHIGICCYEVDDPVLDPLAVRFGRAAVAAATVATRPGHFRLSLSELALSELARLGVGPPRCASLAECCTFCDPRGFASYRRDGERAGRMLHYISPV